MNFKPGDLCRVRPHPWLLPEYRGRECIVKSPLIKVRGLSGRRHVIEMEGGEPGLTYYSHPSNLEKLPPPYLAGSWNECVWKPKVLTR